MSLAYYLDYRCQSCGVALVGNRCVDTPKRTLELVFADGPLIVGPKTFVHECGAGRFGVAVLVGTTLREAPPQEKP